MTGPVYFVLCTRRYKGKKYRTYYYLDCFDGKPRLGGKEEAARFEFEDAQAITDQLARTHPNIPFVFFEDSQKPPARKAWAFPAAPAQPQQVDAFPVELKP